MLDWTKEFEELDDEFKKEVAEFPEVMCYFLINVIGETISKYNRAKCHPERPSLYDDYNEKDIMGLRIKQTYVVQQLTRFGLDKPCEGPDGGYAPTPEYREWFDWWHQYCQHTLTGSEWAELEQKLNNKEDVSAWRPEGHWSGDPEKVTTNRKLHMEDNHEKKKTAD